MDGSIARSLCCLDAKRANRKGQRIDSVADVAKSLLDFDEASSDDEMSKLDVLPDTSYIS
jgi:hypothetical protein